MKYNIWHIELYQGWSEDYETEKCNVIKDIIIDSDFSKDQVEDMLTAVYGYDDRYLEIHKCELVKSNQKLWLEDI